MLETRTWKLSLQWECGRPRIKSALIKKATNSTNPSLPAWPTNPTQHILSFCHPPLLPFGLQRLTGCLVPWVMGWLQGVGGCLWSHIEPYCYVQEKHPILLLPCSCCLQPSCSESFNLWASIADKLALGFHHACKPWRNQVGWYLHIKARSWCLKNTLLLLSSKNCFEDHKAFSSWSFFHSSSLVLHV